MSDHRFKSKFEHGKIDTPAHQCIKKRSFFVYDELGNILHVTLNTNNELVTNKYTLDENLVKEMQLSNLPFYLRYRIRNNRN